MSPVLEFDGVTVDFDGFTALDDVDFSIDAGELRFLIGPNGAGKTTLIDAVTGLNRPSTGQIRFLQQDITKVADHRRVAMGIGRSFQAPTIFDGLTVAENVDLAATHRMAMTNRFGARRSATARSVAEVLDRVGLGDRLEHSGANLGHGDRRWLEVAMLLIQEPRLFLFDEPAAGMSQEERTKLGELLVELAADRTVMVVEHDMAFMRRYAQRVSVLHRGRILTEGTVDAIQNDPRVKEIYLGRSREERTGATPIVPETGQENEEVEPCRS